MLKAGPSVCVAVSMLTVVDVGSTKHERQLAALFLAPEIHSKVILYVASSRLHQLTLLFAFFSIKELHEWFMIIFHSDVDTLQVVIPLSYCIIDSISLLFGCAPFSLSLCECV